MLKQARSDMNLSQEAIAALQACHFPQWRKWISGKMRQECFGNSSSVGRRRLRLEVGKGRSRKRSWRHLGKAALRERL